MFGKNRRKGRTAASVVRSAVEAATDSLPAQALLEPLEARTMLSSSGVSTTMHTDLLRPAVATTATGSGTSTGSDTSTDVEGFTPSQIATAYGFSGITFDNGTVTGNGAGQTIAIIDAYNDPNIASDLSTFDSEFNIAAPPSLSVVNETGGSKLPSDDADWDAEISLDVEWAHAIAPGANILLVEANSDSTDDLMDAVNYARSATGVSVVSMSWGGSEFFDFGGGEFSSETDYDPYFTTPTGHEGVTFVAAAGDSGSASGVQWPAASPNVLSVGGTTLTTDDNGDYQSESGWSGTSGGFSQIEIEPSYQDAVQSSGVRSTPDVAYDADPNSGFAVYDSVPDDGYSGWQEVGGTSAGAPQWAALVAIADQGRTLAGTGTLDGVSQTLPDLYALYGAPDTSAYTAYTDDFNDITSGGAGGTRFRWGGYGNQGSDATIGYDTVTGLGTPKASAIVDALSGSTTTTTGSGSTGSSGSGSSGSGSSGSGTTSSGGSGTVTQTLPASQVSVTIISSAPNSVVGGTAGSAILLLTNTQSSIFDGPVTITLYASTDGTTDASAATELTQISVAKLPMKADANKLVKLTFKYPTDVTNGDYYLVASLTATEAGTAPAVAASATQVAITQPFTDLAIGFGTAAITVIPGTKDSAIVEVTNVGNVEAVGKFSLSLIDTADDDTLLTYNSPKLGIKAGKTLVLKLKFTAPAALPAGSYDVAASLSDSLSPADSDSTDKLDAVPTVG